MTDNPVFPEIEVQLTGEDGNAFFIISRVSAALRRHGVKPERINTFQQEAMSGNYDNVLRTCMAWVTVH